MIVIAGNIIPLDRIVSEFQPNSMEMRIARIMAGSNQRYEYTSMEQFRFELRLRVAIIDASRGLLRSRIAFRVFRKAHCNEAFWELTPQGGFLLKSGVKPYDAIRDIFRNGHLYGTECATAIVIVYYGALTQVYPEELFNRVFSRIHLMNWMYLDRNMDIGYFENEADYLPGDCRYVKNPEVDPETPHWQGENAIDLGNGTYYGHGMGIRTMDEIIAILNRNRRPGATQSAYLLDSATRPNFKHLANIYNRFTAEN